MNSKESKVLLISGGMGGLGRALAKASLSEGHKVALLYRSSSLEEVASCKAEFGESALFLHADITHPEELEHVIQATLEEFGKIDVCIHSAVSAIHRSQLANLSSEEFREQFESSVFGAFSLFSAVLPYMRKAGSGSLIGITSSVLEVDGGGAQMGAYTSAKFALRGLLREFARELTADGIHVNAVAPDLLDTPLNNDLPPKYLEFAAEASPSGKLMTVEEVAQSVLRIVRGDIPTGTSVLVRNGTVSPL